MPSIVDMIADAENKAETIKAEALAKAKERVAMALSECEKAEKSASAEVKQMLLIRRENALHSAARLSSEIIASRAKETQNNCAVARRELDKAAKYIIERVVL